jgi:sulfur transfer complex TusBCD TusB component (DsrH family)
LLEKPLYEEETGFDPMKFFLQEEDVIARGHFS